MRGTAADVRLFSRSPALILAACFAVGIAAASAHEPVKALLWAIPLVLSACGLLLLLGLWLTRAGREQLAFPAAALGFVVAGSATVLLFPFRFPPGHLSNAQSWGFDLTHPVRLVGRLTQDSLPTASGLQIDLQAEGFSDTSVQSSVPLRPASGRVRLWLQTARPFPRHGADEIPALDDGDWIEAVVRLRPPHVYYNPGSFDFRHRAESIDDLYWEGTIEGVPRRLQQSAPPTADALLRGVRNSLGRAIDRVYPPWSRDGRDGAVLKAILLGDRSSLDSSIVDPFRRTGLYHLLVIAGLHVGLLAFLVMSGLRLIGLSRTPRNLMLLAILTGYALIVEQRAPTLRATVMVGIFIVAGLLDRDHAALNAIGLAAVALLFSRPAWLFDSGFQLSFSAALVIAGIAVPVLELTTEPYRRALHRLDDIERDVALTPRASQYRLDLRSIIAALRRRWSVLDSHPEVAERLVRWPVKAVLWLIEIVLFSAVLQIGVLLPMVETFHRVTLAGIGLNALAIPLLTVLLAIALPTIVLVVVSPALAVWPAKVLAVALAGLFSLTELPRLPEWLSYRVPEPPAAIALGFALSLLAVGLFLAGSRRGLFWSVVVFAAFAALVMIHPFAPQLPSGSLEVTALDCGRGQAVLLALPDGATVLVGAGGAARSPVAAGAASNRWDPGENIVSPYLWSRGIKRLDVLIAPSSRGLDGFLSILQNFRVRELWYAHQVAPELPVSLDNRMILDQARQRGVRVRELSAATLKVGTTSFDIFTPLSQADLDPGLEDDSLVLRVTAGQDSVLLASTLSTRDERQMLESGPAFQSDVLVDVHPAPDSNQHSEFLKRVSPRIVIVTDGAEEESVPTGAAAFAGVQTCGTRSLRTDHDGAVTVEMTASLLRVRTFRGGRCNVP